ncbi:MAG: DUF3524 domain-containing protein [Pseudomonadales bacterium]|jgi:glycosyltransferase involved in cell wall biosynthesis|nr:DUF3524 domain-containing protein [Pseudomonadales bacterium]
MDVLLLDAYDADSHRRLREGLVTAFPAVRFTERVLPPRHFAWRAGGNALAFAEAVPRNPRPDRLLAAGPVDLATLRGLRPDLASVPTVCYVHEHEFAYPGNPRERGRLERQLRMVYALLAADRVLVNSRYGADTLLAGVEALLARFPDAVPAGIVRRIADRLAVAPIPLEDALLATPRRRRDPARPLEVVWNHRWEWDKGPDRLPVIADVLERAGLRWRLHLLGRRFRTRPAAFDALEARLPPGHPARGCWGRIEDRDAYRTRLADADVVLSTALHDFQGLSVLEAVALGCAPVVPDRLAYREFLPRAALVPGDADDADRDGAALAARLLAEAERPTAAPDLASLTWSRQRAAWAAHLGLPADGCVGGRP